MVDDGGDAKDGRVAAVVLEMSEEEGEDEPHADPHHPGGEGESQEPQVGEGLHHGSKLRHRPQLAGEHFHSLRLLFQSLLLVLLRLRTEICVI